MANSRREAGEVLYRQKFIEFGLSDSFEFLRREWSLKSDKRFWSRCKSCGCEFISWNEVFRGRQSHLLCPQCGASSDGNDVWERSPKCDEAMTFYVAGHSVRETAEKFGVSMAQINNSVKCRGLANGRSFYQKGRTTRANIEEHLKAEHKIKERLLRFNLDYLGGYSGTRSRVKIKCKQCGHSFERSISHVRKGNLICRNCCGLPEFEDRRVRHMNYGHNHHERAIKYGCVYDSSVTLKKLIKRDGLRCAICGKMCDPDDCSWSKYSGPMRPSIDHIIPMAKGGGHIWSNVQVAHLICNTIKSDKVV